MSNNTKQRLLTAEEIAPELRTSRQGVYALARSGAIPSYRMGKRLLFSLDEVLRASANINTEQP